MKINRRRFIGSLVILGISDGMSKIINEPLLKIPKCEVRRITYGPKHHFFGYYGICPWNKSGKYLICLESEFQDHMPLPDEPVSIGLIDTQTGIFSKITETHAWNFQQGAMLHWNPLNPDNEIIFNDRRRDKIISIITNVFTGEKRELLRPVNAVSHNGKFALSLTYGRLGRLRNVVGYSGIEDPNPNSPHPDNDGIFLMNLTTGKSKLVVSIERVYKMIEKTHPELKDTHMWFNHTVFNKNDTRFFFLARTRKPDGKLETGMFTANLDGSELRQVIPYGKSVSHFDWRNDKEIIATFKLNGTNRVHVLFTDGKDDYKRLGDGCLDFDGHCSFSPNQKWLVTERKIHDGLKQSLIIYNIDDNQCYTIVSLDMRESRFMSGNLRCDFHPRWDRTGNAICFDGIDSLNGTRQLHIAYIDFS